MSNSNTNTHDGTLVSFSTDELVSNCMDGKQHHHTIDEDAKVICEGKISHLTDIAVGTLIRLTTSEDDPNRVTAIESDRPRWLPRTNVTLQELVRRRMLLNRNEVNK